MNLLVKNLKYPIKIEGILNHHSTLRLLSPQIPYRSSVFHERYLESEMYPQIVEFITYYLMHSKIINEAYTN